eukprot:7220402-Alexandrium_andersonii.AAC.1
MPGNGREHRMHSRMYGVSRSSPEKSAIGSMDGKSNGGGGGGGGGGGEAGTHGGGASEGAAHASPDT